MPDESVNSVERADSKVWTQANTSMVVGSAHMAADKAAETASGDGPLDTLCTPLDLNTVFVISARKRKQQNVTKTSENDVSSEPFPQW